MVERARRAAGGAARRQRRPAAVAGLCQDGAAYRRTGLIACDQALYDAAEAGDLAVRDADGFNVGLDGGLRDGSKLFTGKPDE